MGIQLDPSAVQILRCSFTARAQKEARATIIAQGPKGDAMMGLLFVYVHHLYIYRIDNIMVCMYIYIYDYVYSI